MKNKTLKLAAVSFLLSLQFASAQEPSRAGNGHCAQNLGRLRVNADGTFHIPDEITVDGREIVQSVEQREGVTTILINEHSRAEISHEGGKVKQIRFYQYAPGVVTADGIYAVSEYNYRNGICYISRTADFGMGQRNNRTGEVGALVRRDTNACREVMTYFERNPSAAACSCGNPGEDAKLREVLERHQIPMRVSSFTAGRSSGREYQVAFSMSPAYSQNNNNARIVAPAAGDGTYQAINLVEHCLSNSLMRAALSDRRLWAGDPAMESPEASGALQAPAR